jgi:DNA repair protein RecN (Recombination protein N)
VNLALMKELGEHLVNIHSQFSVITLNDADFQLAVLDNYSANAQIIQKYREDFILYTRMNKELGEMVRQEAMARKDKDYYQFLWDELDAAKLLEDEQEEAEKRLDILSHAEEIKTGLLQALEMLSTGEQNIADRLSDIVNVTNNLTQYHPALPEIRERILSNQIDLRDIAAGMEKIEQEVYFDPSDINALSARLDLIYHLEKKHNVTGISGLISIRDQISLRLLEATSLEDRILILNKEIEQFKEMLLKQSEKLSENRRKVISELQEKLRITLVKLGMHDARIEIELTRLDELTPDGMDAVRFLFSANKGIGLNEISRIASGGELSRLMLSIKSLISKKNLLPTIIFDEIDMGVSGEVAGKVGDILKKMGETMQVIAITHLPQIAGKGQSHYWVFKTNEKESTRTQLKKLDSKERVVEIAKMLSNEKISDAALKTAKELMGN